VFYGLISTRVALKGLTNLWKVWK